MNETNSRLLSGVKLLAGVPHESRMRLAMFARSKRYSAGEALFRRGEPGEGLLLVLDGLVRIHLADPKGREITLALLGPGEPIGEIALIDGGERSADATAMTPVSALLIRHSDAASLIGSDPAMATAMLRTMAERLRRLTDQVEAVSLQPLTQRLAAVLLRLSTADPSGLVRVAQGHLATLVAASRPKVNAVLADYRARGLIVATRAGLRLVDRDGLRALANDA